MNMFWLYVKKIWYIIIRAAEKLIEINKQLEEAKIIKAEKKREKNGIDF